MLVEPAVFKKMRCIAMNMDPIN